MSDEEHEHTGVQEGVDYEVWTPLSADKLREIIDDGQKIIEEQRESLPEFQIEKLEKDAKRNWDIFYKRNGNRFFKDRHWLVKEFRELMCEEGDEYRIFEVGCGVGNTIFPLLELNPKLFVHACDFSPRAVDLVKKHEMYTESRCNAFVCDITKDPFLVPEESLDAISLIFVLSAINPIFFEEIVLRLRKLLKPNRGAILFRDYGICDLSQIRKKGKKLGENFYVRGDGTRTYYFSTEYVTALMEKAGFQVIQNTYCAREVVNRKRNLRMHRIWVHGRFMRKDDKPEAQGSSDS